jgi:hypothetical protein
MRIVSGEIPAIHWNSRWVAVVLTSGEVPKHPDRPHFFASSNEVAATILAGVGRGEE